MSHPASFKFPPVGILGGGQLGKMLCQQASKWSLITHVLDTSQSFPAGSVCTHFTEGDFTDYRDVMTFGRNLPLLTIEIESVNSDALHELSEIGIGVHPNPGALDITKDKYLQKRFYQKHGLPTSTFMVFEGISDVRQALAQNMLVFPFVLKKRKDGYDGRGVHVAKTPVDLEHAFDAPCIAETLIDIELEVSVIVARNASAEIRSFPPVGMTFHPTANLVEYLFCPAGIGPALEQEAIQIAQASAEAFDICGLLAVEMFITTDGEILINEVAPRPHNSGHHTIEACTVSQYEQHLRGILNLPLADVQLRSPAVMVNLLGETGFSGEAKYSGLKECLHLDDVHVHLYGKAETKPWRKMGHATILASTMNEAMKKAKFVKDTLKIVA